VGKSAAHNLKASTTGIKLAFLYQLVYTAHLKAVWWRILPHTNLWYLQLELNTMLYGWWMFRKRACCLNLVLIHILVARWFKRCIASKLVQTSIKKHFPLFDSSSIYHSVLSQLKSFMCFLQHQWFAYSDVGFVHQWDGGFQCNFYITTAFPFCFIFS